MVESIFINYFWVMPVLWVTLILFNRVLGNYIISLNQNLMNPKNPEKDNQQKTKFNFTFLLRTVLVFPVMIIYWWFFTRLFRLYEIYLLITGYFLLSLTTAIIMQLSSLFMQYFLSHYKLDSVLNKDVLQISIDNKFVMKANDYLGFLLIYLIVTFLTQSWIIAGGTIACLFSFGKNVINIRNTVAT
jgi:hypothetical protein